MLRHFGALWAMLDARGHDPACQAAAARGVQWAINTYYEQAAPGGAFRQHGWLVTGSSGLALLTFDELAPEHSQAFAADVRPEIVDFLLAQQITEGPLRHDFPHRIALNRLSIDLSRDWCRSVRRRGVPEPALHRPDPARVDRLPVAGGRLARTTSRFRQVYSAVGRAMAALVARGEGITQRSPG